MLARAVRGAPQAAGDVQRTLSVMDDWVLDARVDQIRAFVSVLGALKLSKRQLVQVSVAERGVTIVSQDLSKSLQAQVNFRAETFLSYRVNAAAAGTQGHHGTTSAGSGVPGSQYSVSLFMPKTTRACRCSKCCPHGIIRRRIIRLFRFCAYLLRPIGPSYQMTVR